MKKNIFILLGICLPLVMFGQKKKPTKKTPPKTYQYEDVGNAVDRVSYQQMLDGRKLKFSIKYPSSYLKDKEVTHPYREEIVIEDREVQIHSFSYYIDLLNDSEKRDVETIRYYEMDIDRDFMILISKKDGKRYRYKMFTNKDKTEIIKLEDLAEKKFFNKEETEEEPILMEEKKEENK